jgi:hypothetical protein
VLRFYPQHHKHYGGIDLHARARYVCILDQHGAKLVHKNLPTTPEAFLRVVTPSRDELGVGWSGSSRGRGWRTGVSRQGFLLVWAMLSL